jgi:hypothetical protein
MEEMLSHGERIQSSEDMKTVSPRLVGVFFCDYYSYAASIFFFFFF